MTNAATSDLPILDDPEWALLLALEDKAIGPLGVAADADAVAEAAGRTSFDETRLQSALSSLTSKQVLVGFGEGAVQITGLGRELIAARRI